MTLDIGILGYRFMGKAHSNALDRLPMFFDDAPETNRDVIVGRDEAALADAAETLGFDRTATDWRDVVDEVDAFYNLGPNHVHAEPSIAALEAGTPVFCEKPLAPTLKTAQEMADAATDSGVVHGAAFNYRFVPALRKARNLIETGELGEIHHFRGRYLQDWLVDSDAPWSWRNDEGMAGSGALGDLGAHTVDLAHFLLGDTAGDIDRVSGHLRTFVDERPVEGVETPEESREEGDGATVSSDETRAVTVDDAYSAQVEFENGAIGTLEASRFANGCKNDHTIEIEGSEGALRFNLERLNELELKRAGNRGFETVLVTDPDDPYIDHWWPPGHVIGWEHTFVHENYEFLSAIRDGTDYQPSFADGLKAQRVLDAIERSDESGEWVSVE